MSKKVKNAFKNHMVLSVVVLVLVGLTSFVFAADVTVKGGTVYIGNNVFFKALNNAGTGTVDLIKANASDVAVIPDGSELASSAAPTADAGIANKKYVDDEISAAVPDGGTFCPAGAIISFGGMTAPSGWLLCDGSAVSRTTYSTLFSAIGTNYGVGDGAATFNLPDMRGRVSVGKSTDTEFDTLGEAGGAKTHTLTIPEMPAHTHNYSIPSRTSGSSFLGWYDAYSGSAVTSSTGGSSPHNNLQPYQVVNYIIKY